MNFSVSTIAYFDKQFKKLLKKFPSLKGEIEVLIKNLSTSPKTSGTPLGHDCFKVRLSIASKGKGKSGGARIIYYIYISGSSVYLLSIYDKAEKDSISDRELAAFLKKIPK